MLRHSFVEQVDIAQTNRNQGIEIARLKSQIVQSPDKLRGSIEQLGLDLSREQENLRLLEAKERQMSGKIASLTKYESVSCFFHFAHVRAWKERTCSHS